MDSYAGMKLRVSPARVNRGRAFNGGMEIVVALQ
jgi:hypothetical protein